MLDLREFDAGTYYLRAYRPNGGLDARTFSFEFMAPPPGQTRPRFENPDRDTIHGGDGNDFLLGNEGLDVLFGESGRDVFTSDVLTVTPQGGALQTTLRGVEVRDFDGDRPLVNLPASESTGQ